MNRLSDFLKKKSTGFILKCEYLLLLLVIYDRKRNIFGFWAVGLDI